MFTRDYDDSLNILWVQSLFLLDPQSRRAIAAAGREPEQHELWDGEESIMQRRRLRLRKAGSNLCRLLLARRG
jgi:hypothetical protein